MTCRAPFTTEGLLLPPRVAGGAPVPRFWVADSGRLARGGEARRRHPRSPGPFESVPGRRGPGRLERRLPSLARSSGFSLGRRGVVLEAGAATWGLPLGLPSKGVRAFARDQSLRRRRPLFERAGAAAATAPPSRDAVFDSVLADVGIQHVVLRVSGLWEIVRILRSRSYLLVHVYRLIGFDQPNHCTVGGLLRIAKTAPPFDALTRRIALPAFCRAADGRYLRPGEQPGGHDVGVSSSWFSTPPTTSARGTALCATPRHVGPEVLAYEVDREVDGFPGWGLRATRA